MEIGKGSIGLLAALCIGAGAGGAYFATRTAAPIAPEAATAITPTAVEPEAAVTLPSSPTGRPAGIRVAPVRPTPLPKNTRPSEPAPARQTTEAVEPVVERAAVADTPVVNEPVEAPAPPAVADVQPARPVKIPPAQIEELVVAADSVVGLEVETSVSSERARVEDPVVALVTRDVRVGDRVAIPAGSKAHGQVTLVERGGRLKERARLGVRFTSIVLPDGNRLSIRTDTVFRDDSPAMARNAKIGAGAIGGAIIGGILGGGKGSAIGGSVGAGAGTAAVMTGGRSVASLPSGTPVTVRLQDPVTVMVEK